MKNDHYIEKGYNLNQFLSGDQLNIQLVYPKEFEDLLNLL